MLAAGMWEPSRALLDGSLVMGHAEIAAAVRILVERARVVAEGAGASSVAAALAGKAGTGKVVCVVSGGNIDTAVLRTILEGGIPGPASPAEGPRQTRPRASGDLPP